MGDCEQAPMEQPAHAQASKKGGRLKKLRKWVARGDVYNKARLDECVAAGLAPQPTAKVVPPQSGGRVAHMKKDVGGLVWRVLAPRLADGCYVEPESSRDAAKEWPPWLEVGNAAAVARLVLLSVSGLDDATLPSLQGGVKAKCYETRHAPGERRALDAVAAAPPPWEAPPPRKKKRGRKRKRQAAGDDEEEEEEEDDDDEGFEIDSLEAVGDFLLSREQMEANEYPLPSPAPRAVAAGVFAADTAETGDDGEDLGAPADAVPETDAWALPAAAAAISEACRRGGEGWAETVAVEGAEVKPPRVFGLDCEMVKTTRGSECARCTVVDGATGATVLDELVAPGAPVVDYCTQWSGIDAKTLKHVATTLDDVRGALLREVRPTDVLVGHGLDNDLRCLRLAHGACADTALLFGHPRGPGYKRSLKHLCKEFLGRDVQSGAHDSAEDATGALDLFRLKLDRGIDFGARGAGLAKRSSLERLAAGGCRVAVAAAGGDALRASRAPPPPRPGKKETVLACVEKQLAAGWHLLVGHVDVAGRADGAAPDLAEVDRLDQRRKAATDHRASAVWTDAQEAELQAALNAAAFGTAVVGPPGAPLITAPVPGACPRSRAEGNMG
ncbi:exonuclease [Aureococcus anophagefferens]|uniref:Exonuclease n=2 Tax=Aureococcus anophagefferens TaxID=44056 RepID=A0ABR1FI24_AURAN